MITKILGAGWEGKIRGPTAEGKTERERGWRRSNTDGGEGKEKVACNRKWIWQYTGKSSHL